MPKEQKIIARVVIQMMGSPKKHIVETLNMYVEKIEEEFKDIKVLEEFKSKPKKEGEMYNVFTELEIETKGVESLVWFCFDYLPASVEIMEPSDLFFNSHDMTDFLNDLQAKLHKTDMVIKNLSAENQVIRKNGMTLLTNIIKLSLKSGSKTLAEISEAAGVPEDHLQKVCKALVNEGKIKEADNKYSL